MLLDIIVIPTGWYYVGPVIFDEEVARKTWRVLEVCHGMIYFAPEAMEAYAELGLSAPQGYFASRSAALGDVAPEVVIATFYNFNPRYVRESITGVWTKTTPEAVLAARHGAASKTLSRVFGDTDVTRVAELLREAATAVADDFVGRPLYAAHAALPWPTEPHLVLWHAQTLLREYRGDAHVAALLTAGLSGIDALVTHAAAGGVAAETLRKSRNWSETEWQQAIESLRARDWLTDAPDPTFTPTGQSRREALELATDRNAVRPYAHIGLEACEELQTLGRPLSRAVAEAVMPWALSRT